MNFKKEERRGLIDRLMKRSLVVSETCCLWIVKKSPHAKEYNHKFMFFFSGLTRGDCRELCREGRLHFPCSIVVGNGFRCI